MHRPAPLARTVSATGIAGLLLTGCTSGAARGPAGVSPSATRASVLPQDAEAFRLLDRVAPASLDLKGGTVTSTGCWTPSEHLFDDPDVAPAGTWKVLCRVRYRLDGQRRYQDATCIGDFDLTPMLTHCYVWEYYTYEPRYRDGNRLASPPPPRSS